MAKRNINTLYGETIFPIVKNKTRLESLSTTMAGFFIPTDYSYPVLRFYMPRGGGIVNFFATPNQLATEQLSSSKIYRSTFKADSTEAQT